MLLRLAFRNVFRQRTRSAMTLAAIVVSVVALILSGGFVQDIFVQLGEAVIHSQSGHVQIAKKGFFGAGSRNPEQYMIDDPEAIARRVAALPGVADVMTRLGFSGLLNNGRADLAIVGEGVQPAKEARLGTYVRIVAGRGLVASDRYAILLGEGVAHSLALAPGDRASLLLGTPEGAMNVQEFTVAGVFQSFSKEYDARTVKLPLAAAQELLDTRGANVLVVSLRDTGSTAKARHAIDTLLAGSGLATESWQQLNDFYGKTVDLYDRQLSVLRAIVLLMVLLGVANTTNMTVYERTGEVGTMRAIGNRRRFVFSLLMTESALLGAIGAAIGVALGVVLALSISRIGIPMPPPPNSNLGYLAQVRVVPAQVAAAAAIGFVATVAACIVPALRVSRVPVVDALRHNG